MFEQPQLSAVNIKYSAHAGPRLGVSPLKRSTSDCVCHSHRQRGLPLQSSNEPPELSETRVWPVMPWKGAGEAMTSLAWPHFPTLWPSRTICRSLTGHRNYGHVKRQLRHCGDLFHYGGHQKVAVKPRKSSHALLARSVFSSHLLAITCISIRQQLPALSV